MPRTPEKQREAGEVTLPTYIDEISLGILSGDYGERDGQPRYEASVTVEDWLVEPEMPEGILARLGEYELQDMLGPNGWTQTIKGEIVCAGVFPAGQYINTANAPMLVLAEAKIISPHGSPVDVVPEGSGRKIMIRLDQLNSPLLVEPIT